MTGEWISFLIVIFPIAVGFGIGRWRERSHYRSLAAREAQGSGTYVSNLKQIAQPKTAKSASLVMGQAVIATDYFKSFAAQFRNIIGGEVRTYETLMERARREAKLRMMDEAHALGATEVWNVRFETSNIMSSGPRNPAVSVEVFAFGTAVIRQ